MATIHQGRNVTEEELQQFADAYVNEKKKSWKPIEKEQKKRQQRERKSYRKSVRQSASAIVFRLLILAALLLFPQIMTFLQDALQDLCSWLNNLQTTFLADLMILDNPNPLQLLLNWGITILSLALDFVLGWIGKLSEPIIKIVLYGWLIISLFDNITQLIFDMRCKPTIPDPIFDEKAARSEAMLQLPTDLEIQKAGLEGERSALFSLWTLPDNCHVFTNLLIPYEGKTSETDLVIVAPHAITIMEVKNYKDEIRGDWADEQLTNVVHRGENVHTKEFYNPVKQVATHAFRLKGFLRENGIDIWVNTCVNFVHLDVELRWMSDRTGVLAKCPVFTFRSPDMKDYILGASSRQQNIPVNRVVKLLDDLLQNPPPRPQY